MKPLLFTLVAAVPALGQDVPPQRGCPLAEFLRAGVARYWPSRAAAEAAGPSLVLQAPFAVMGEPPPAAWSVPVFSQDGGRHIATLPMDDGVRYFGCGLATGPRPLNGRVVQANIGDGVIPWVLAVRPDGSCLGVLADTTRPCEVDLTQGITFRAAEVFPVLEALGENPMQIVGSLAVQTGWMELPPLWALGYQHADPSLRDEAGVMAAARMLRERGIPADSLAIGTPGHVSDPSAFPDLKRLTDELRQMGFRTVWSVPLEAEDDAAPPAAWIPGSAEAGPRLPDFSSEAARGWWGGHLAPLLSAGIDGVDLDAPDQGSLRNAKFGADAALGGPGDGGLYASVYPVLAARATREAFAAARPEVRPFITGAASGLGMQRQQALWIDPTGTDEDALEAAMRRALQASTSARFLVGLGVPGAARGSDGAALARWISVASLLPIIRAAPLEGHSAEPWAFSPEVEATVRRALVRRSRLMPYMYSVAFEAFRFDYPALRPLLLSAPLEPGLQDEAFHFTLGGDVLVDARPPDPVRTPVPMPPGVWRPFQVDDTDTGLPPLYLRAGAIIPLGPAVAHAGEKALEPLELIVALDESGQAAGFLYEDDTDGFAYTTNQARVAYYSAQRTGDTVIVKMGRLDGGWTIAKRALVVRVLLEGGGEASAEFRDALDVHVKLP